MLNLAVKSVFQQFENDGRTNFRSLTTVPYRSDTWLSAWRFFLKTHNKVQFHGAFVHLAC